VDLSGTPIEAWAALGFFWLLGATVFYQFFTRYVLNDSAAWTEEIARYLLIGTVFTARHRRGEEQPHPGGLLLPLHAPPMAAGLALAGGRAAHGLLLARPCVLTWQMMQKLGSYKMTIIDLPMNIVYGVCLLGFAPWPALGAGCARALASAATACWSAPNPPWTTADRKPHAQDHFPAPHGGRHPGGHRHGRLVADLHPVDRATCRRSW
jgi:TRAP-type C4-dicarboxylate transport system permease small subunit